MAAAGIFTAAQLVKRCEPKFTPEVSFTRQTVSRWLKMETAELSLELATVLCDCLNIRLWWLSTGKGGAAREHVERVLAILDKLDDAQREKWLKAGERMG